MEHVHAHGSQESNSGVMAHNLGSAVLLLVHMCSWLTVCTLRRRLHNAATVWARSTIHAKNACTERTCRPRGSGEWQQLWFDAGLCTEASHLAPLQGRAASGFPGRLGPSRRFLQRLRCVCGANLPMSLRNAHEQSPHALQPSLRLLRPGARVSKRTGPAFPDPGIPASPGSRVDAGLRPPKGPKPAW